MYPNIVTLNNANGKSLAYLASDYHLMYHLLKIESLMDSYFYAATNYLSTE